MKKSEYIIQQQKALEYFKKANIVLTKEEISNIEVADFGLNRVNEVGLQLVVYVNTNRVCAKEMVLLPNQVCPEHRHIQTNGNPGKEETFRCRYGTVYLYTDGDNQKSPDEILTPIPSTKVTVFKETVLHAGEQYTIMPNTLHWFVGGSDGAVVSEFSTHSTDETDVFTDENIIRIPSIEE